MNYRYMRILVFFDLPVETVKNRRDYREFRKFLLKSGFMMVQESVYCKLIQNSTMANSMVDSVRKNKPPEGLVQILSVTEKQYQKMEYVVGSSRNDVIDSDERLLVF